MEETQSSSTKGQNILEKMSFVLLFFVGLVTPIFFVPASFISTQFGSSLLFGFGVIFSVLAYILSSLSSGYIDMPKSNKLLLWSILAVPLVYILAGISNGFSRMVFLGYTFDISTVGFIILSFIFLFLVSLLFRDKKKIFYTYLGFALTSVITALFLISRMIFGVKFLSMGIFNDMTSTIIGNWNNVGIFFGALTLLSLLSHEMLSLNRLMKICLSVLLLVSLFFLALVNFTTIWVVVGISSFLFVVYRMFVIHNYQFTPVMSTWRLRFSKVSLYPVIVFAIALIFVIWSGSVGSFLSNKLSITNVDVRPSLSVTLDIAKNTIASRPLFGSGPNTFVTQWLSYKPADITSTVFWNTDFTYGIGLLPTFAVTTGLIGILSWILFFGYFLYLGVKAIFSRFEDKFVMYLVTSSFFVSVYFWVMSWIYIPSAVIFIMTFMFSGLFFSSIYLAGLVKVSSYPFSINPRSGFVMSLVLVATFVACGALAFGLFKSSQSMWYFQKSVYAASKDGGIADAENYMNKAISSVPYDIYYRSLAQIEVTKLSQVVSQDTTKVSKDEIQKEVSDSLSSAISAALNARNTDPSNYLNWIALGQVYDSAVSLKIPGAYESASFSYNEAFRRNPKNPGIALLFSKLESDNGNLAQAKNYALQAIQMKQNYLDAYYLLAQIEVANKNLKGAIDATSAAVVLNPNDPNTLFQLGILKYNAQDFSGAIESFEKSIGAAPDYSNAKYFLGLSYELTKEHQKAIEQFQDLKKSNPDNKDVDSILSLLLAGKPIFTNPSQTKTTKSSTLPVKENL